MLSNAVLSVQVERSAAEGTLEAAIADLAGAERKLCPLSLNSVSFFCLPHCQTIGTVLPGVTGTYDTFLIDYFCTSGIVRTGRRYGCVYR